MAKRESYPLEFPKLPSRAEPPALRRRGGGTDLDTLVSGESPDVCYCYQTFRRATPLGSSPDVAAPAVIWEEEDPNALLTKPRPLALPAPPPWPGKSSANEGNEQR